MSIARQTFRQKIFKTDPHCPSAAKLERAGLTEGHFQPTIHSQENLMSLGVPEIILIVIVIALLFGGRKLPELGKGLGQGIKNFKNALKGDNEKENGKSDNGEPPVR